MPLREAKPPRKANNKEKRIIFETFWEIGMRIAFLLQTSRRNCVNIVTKKRAGNFGMGIATPAHRVHMLSGIPNSKKHPKLGISHGKAN